MGKRCLKKLKQFISNIPVNYTRILSHFQNEQNICNIICKIFTFMLTKMLN